MDILRKPIYNTISRTLFWWQYKPTDEREYQLFQQAYRRFFWAIVLLIAVSISVLEMYITELVPLPDWSVERYFRMIEGLLLLVLVVSSVVGSTAFHKQEITLKAQHNAITYALPIFVVVDAIILIGLWLLGK